MGVPTMDGWLTMENTIYNWMIYDDLGGSLLQDSADFCAPDFRVSLHEILKLRERHDPFLLLPLELVHSGDLKIADA